MAEISIVPLNEIVQADRWDGEYFKPSYRKLGEQLRYLCNLSISDISTLSNDPFDPDTVEHFKYIEISNVDTLCGEIRFEEVNSLNTPDRAQFLMKGGEILISTVRPNRSAIGLLPFFAKGCVASSGFAPLLAKDSRWRSYLFIWLKTKTITNWLERHSTASMYPAVSVRDILNTPCYSPSDELLDKIHNIVDSAANILSNGRQLYPEAELELLDRMNWGNLAKKPLELFYIEKFNETQKSGRIDAEHFQPKYNRLRAHLEKIGSCPLGEMIIPIINGFDCREWQEDGTPYIRVGDIQKGQISDYCQKIKLESNQIMKDIQIQEGDILFARKGTYGRTGVVNKINESWIISSEIMRLRLNDKVKIIPEYLSLFIESQPGFLQVEKMVHGVSNFSIAQKDMYNILIYLPKNKNGSIDLEWQKKLANKVIQANNAKSEAQAMLEKAKIIVEDSINSAM